MAAETALQGALYGALTGIGLTVKDFGRQEADGSVLGNFVEVGTITMTEFDDFTQIGHNAVARIHVRSDAPNAKVIRDIQGQIFDRLHRGDLSIDGHWLVLMQREQTTVLQGPQGRLTGICDYRIKFTTA